MRTTGAVVIVCLMLLPLWLSATASAQPGRSRTTNTVIETPEPLVRLSKDRDCDRYPGSTRRKSGGGSVSLSYTVDAGGTVTGVTVTGGSGDELLDRGAADCVKSWKFMPLSATGAAAPFSAQAMVTYSFIAMGPRLTSTANWQMPQSKEASDIATSDIAQRAFVCLRQASGIPALAAAAAGPTVLRLTFSAGQISHVVVMGSSSSDTLDKAALACYQAVKPDDDRARMMLALTDARFAVRWRILFPASPAPAYVPPPAQ